MSYGIEIRDASGREVLGPDTFTVRLIDTLYLPPMESSAAVTLSAPKARAGMFATASPHAAYSLPSSWYTWVGDYPNKLFDRELVRRARENDRTARMPILSVTDGGVVVSPPPGCRFSGNMTIYLFATV